MNAILLRQYAYSPFASMFISALRPAFILLTALIFCSHVQALPEQRLALFSQLNKAWFVAELQLQRSGSEPSQSLAQQSDRLILKVLEPRITPARFQQLWSDVQLLSPVAASNSQQHQDWQQLKNLLGGTLQRGDVLMFERQPARPNQAAITRVRVNYREHAQLHADFLPQLINTLTAKIAPLPELKQGLLGKLSRTELSKLQQQFDGLEPSLLRISRTSRWLRKANLKPADALVSQL